MSSAYYIVPKCKIDGFDTFVNGKALASFEGLDELASRCGVRPLIDFYGQAGEEFTDLLEDAGCGIPEEALPEARWFSADEGLSCVRALISGLLEGLEREEDVSDVIQDLREFESVLDRLASEGIPWHLAVDF